jgi:hypothetical protein
VAKLADRRPNLLAAVRRGLCGADADRVIQEFVRYADAVEKAHTAIQTFCQLQQPVRVGFSSVKAYSLWLESCDHWNECWAAACVSRLSQHHITTDLLRLVFEDGAEKAAEAAYLRAFMETKLPLRV